MTVDTITEKPHGKPRRFLTDEERRARRQASSTDESSARSNPNPAVDLNDETGWRADDETIWTKRIRSKVQGRFAYVVNVVLVPRDQRNEQHKWALTSVTCFNLKSSAEVFYVPFGKGGRPGKLQWFKTRQECLCSAIECADQELTEFLKKAA